MGDLLKPLTAMSVTTTLDGHAPNSTRPYTQTANGAKISLEDWWNNTGHPLGFATYGDNKMTWYTWDDILKGRVAKGSYNKQGEVLIKKHQQGGNMEQQEQQEFMKFLIEDALAQGLQIQTEDDVKSYLSQLGEEGIKAKYLQFMQMKGQTPSAKLGSKLNYIKSLKGDCPDNEEIVYFKKGGMICKACEKKKQGAKLEQSKINPVEEFKKGRKTKKC